MTVRRQDDIVRLSGHCRVEDAEALAALLQVPGGAVVDLSGCESLHAAVVQTLLAFGPALVGVPDDGFLRDHLLPALAPEATAG